MENLGELDGLDGVLDCFDGNHYAVLLQSNNYVNPAKVSIIQNPGKKQLFSKNETGQRVNSVWNTKLPLPHSHIIFHLCLLL